MQPATCRASSSCAGSCGVGFVCSLNGTRSREIVSWGIEAVRNLTHRGAVGADGKSGDGAGVLFQIPQRFFREEAARGGAPLEETAALAVGSFFFFGPVEAELERLFLSRGFTVICWRDVPTNDAALGDIALRRKPRIRQLLLNAAPLPEQRREAGLYLARKAIERSFGGAVYVASLSTKTIAYKGLLAAPHLAEFYPDLESPLVESAFCMFHQRFSTNTLPDWSIAQPFRVIAHNGEINTIQGNRNRIAILEHEMRHDLFGGEPVSPLVLADESDSASLDKTVELLILSGYSPAHALLMCIPPAWEHAPFSDRVKAFLEYQSLLMKPWDGPAAVTFTDGATIGAHLDRNGLRPLRYLLTDDGLLVVGSEIGMVELGARTVVEKGRVGPGGIIAVDTAQGTLKHTEQLLEELAAQQPYRQWLDRLFLRLKETRVLVPRADPDLLRKQIAFDYTEEELQTTLAAMAETGSEPTFSMGDDTPIPPLRRRPQLLFSYFKQKFAQVTNPPIDYLRERRVMSLAMNIGRKRNILHEAPENARRLHLDSPVLLESTLREIERQPTVTFQRILTTFPCSGSRPFLPPAVEELQQQVLQAVRGGVELIILSDIDVARRQAAIPLLLAVSASFKALERERLANRVSIIAEAGEARDIHHIACLIGYGASAVYPYLAYETLYELCRNGSLSLSYEEAAQNYKKALDEGLLKVIARMGISTLNTYRGAQLFDTVGLTQDFVDEFFTGTPVTFEADGIEAVEESLIERHNNGYETPQPRLDYGGELRQKKEGEWHAWSPASVVAFNKFIRSPSSATYQEVARTAEERPLFLRHLLEYRERPPLPLGEVEPEERILQRFFSGALSLGALSPEAHETIAAACNRLGIRSNSGEGGEDPARYGGPLNSAIKQVASGRFGVTPAYLASAREIEIKIAQGAKPGEGGHLPSSKVTDYIARLRHCATGTPLISPPPHHDIYSIEDLAQLINDLKEANPEAKICVKLVAQTGVGTVAAGVAKAYADIIQISGGEGGTGASPLGSIKHAGGFWETGLLETQSLLVENGLRRRVVLRVDGGLRTGRDIIIAALLGAEEFGFGTAPMIATGCVMARQCHLNTCPTGIATQDPALRARFRGTVEGVTAYFRAVAQDTRQRLARMGARSIGEIIGESGRLVLRTPEGRPSAGKFFLPSLPRETAPPELRKSSVPRNDNPASAATLNTRLAAELAPLIERAEPVVRDYAIRTADRSVPARLSYLIARRYGDAGLPEDTLRLTFRGTAGQSFGAFTHRGMSLTLIGEANDYVGKGMFGGRIAVVPGAIADPGRHVIVGNTVLYGATGGEFYAAGRAGERFGVRNSGAVAVVEGTGHHLGEYMTRGTVVVLGEAGDNIGAGMTGGVIYIYDEDDGVLPKLNAASVRAAPLSGEEEVAALAGLLDKHHRFTGSPRAAALLAALHEGAALFKKIVPVRTYAADALSAAAAQG